MTEEATAPSPEFVKEYVLETRDDIARMRADSEFCDGAIALFSFPTSPPQIFISYDNPKFMGGQVAYLGDTVSKDVAGNFYVNGSTR